MLVADINDAFLPDGSDLGRLPVAVKGALLHPPVVVGRSIVPLPVLPHSRFAPLLTVSGDEFVVVERGQTPPLALVGSIHVLPSASAVDGCSPTFAEVGCE